MKLSQTTIFTLRENLEHTDRELQTLKSKARDLKKSIAEFETAAAELRSDLEAAGAFDEDAKEAEGAADA